MASNENIEGVVANLDALLNGANNLSELKSFLKSDYSGFVSHWNQCNQMTRLDNYESLKAKINEIEENKWFYIGYTGRLGHYLWDKVPDNRKFREHNLTKTHTYYKCLTGVAEENENALINEFNNHERCLNVNRHGETVTAGIVYLLVYTQ